DGNDSRYNSARGFVPAGASACLWRAVLGRSPHQHEPELTAGLSDPEPSRAWRLITNSNLVGCSPADPRDRHLAEVLTSCRASTSLKSWTMRGPQAASPPSSAVSGHRYIAGRRNAAVCSKDKPTLDKRKP